MSIENTVEITKLLCDNNSEYHILVPAYFCRLSSLTYFGTSMITVVPLLFLLLKAIEPPSRCSIRSFTLKRPRCPLLSSFFGMSSIESASIPMPLSSIFIKTRSPICNAKMVMYPPPFFCQHHALRHFPLLAVKSVQAGKNRIFEYYKILLAFRRI